jgi:addiction module RelE/StbE family toxin
MPLTWSQEALHELASIVQYIARDSPTAATVLFEHIVSAVATLLPTNPHAGRPGRVDATRELIVHASYVVVYQLSEKTIEILTVRHTARLWPESF